MVEEYTTIIRQHGACRGEGCNWCFDGHVYQYVTKAELDRIPNPKIVPQMNIITVDQLAEIILKNG